jgi:hypothetical protein
VASRRNRLAVFVSLVSALTLASSSSGQWLKEGMKELKRPYLDGTPFDLLILNEKGENAIIKLRPPETAFPKELPRGGLYLFKYQEGEQFQVPYSSIASYKTFNDLLIEEGNSLLQERKYSEALRNYLYVYDRGGKDIPELVNSLQRCLFEEAQENLGNGRFEFALTIFEDLYERDPNFQVPGLDKGLIEIILECHDGLLEQAFQANEFQAVRMKARSLVDLYGRPAQELVAKWDRAIEQKRKKLVAQSREEMQSGKGRLAHLYSRQAEQLAPEDPEIKELQSEILRRFPMVVVGITQSGGDLNGQRLEHWGARRVGRLVQRTIVELIGTSDEGGRYAFLNGTLTQVDEMGLRFAFNLNSSTSGFAVPPTSPYQVASQLLAAANPKSPIYNSSWQKVLDQVQIDAGRVLISLRVPFIKPEPLMRIPYEHAQPSRSEASRDFTASIPQPAEAPQNGAYMVVEQNAESTRLERNARYEPIPGAQHPVLIEQLYSNASQAVDELLKGNIDVIDRVPPGDLERLRKVPNIVVRPYVVPTVHLLVPKIRGDLQDNPFFRSGLSHGIDRNAILNKGICNGREIPGCEILSGPFPTGTEENEAIAYAYDPRVRPPIFSSHMASVLVDMSLIMDAQMKAKRAQDEIASMSRVRTATQTAVKEKQTAENEKKDAAELGEKILIEPDQSQAPAALASTSTDQNQTPHRAGESSADQPANPNADAEQPAAGKTNNPSPATTATAPAQIEEKASVKSPAPTLILAHPSSSTATEAARTIAVMWSLLGVPTKTLPLEPYESIPSHDDWDVLYVELAMEEPLTDIMQVVGRDGLASEVTAVTEQTLQQLAFTGSWRSSTNLLRRLHRQLTVDMTIIPLYQVKEHYAYRNTVTGIGRDIIHLYQHIGRWKIDVFGTDEAE